MCKWDCALFPTSALMPLVPRLLYGPIPIVIWACSITISGSFQPLASITAWKVRRKRSSAATVTGLPPPSPSSRRAAGRPGCPTTGRECRCSSPRELCLARSPETCRSVRQPRRGNLPRDLRTRLRRTRDLPPWKQPARAKARRPRPCGDARSPGSAARPRRRPQPGPIHPPSFRKLGKLKCPACRSPLPACHRHRGCQKRLRPPKRPGICTSQ